MRINEGVEDPTIEGMLRALLAFVHAGAPLDTPLKLYANRNRNVVAIEAEFGRLFPSHPPVAIQDQAEAALGSGATL